jgi:hypothetical protein
VPTNEHWFYQTGVTEQTILSVLLEDGDRTGPTLYSIVSHLNNTDNEYCLTKMQNNLTNYTQQTWLMFSSTVRVYSRQLVASGCILTTDTGLLYVLTKVASPVEAGAA